MPQGEKVTLPPGITQEQAKELLKNQSVVFAELDTGYLKKVQIQKSFYKGKELFGIQIFYKEDETEEWKYGKAVNFPPDLIDEVIEGLTKMKAYIEGG